MDKRFWWLLMGLLLLAAGCAVRAEEQLAKLQEGMTQAEVERAIGKPEAVMCVRFPSYERDYLVWQYEMIPAAMPVCPSEGAARTITGIATLGLSEVAWTHAKAKPHWVYFLDGFMVFAGRGFDCTSPAICTIHKDKVAGNTCRE